MKFFASVALFAVSGTSCAQQTVNGFPAGIPVKDSSGCIIQYDTSPDRHRTFKWSGTCVNGKASGPGTQEYFLATGAPAFKITGTKDSNAIFFGPYRREFSDPITRSKATMECNFDANGENDGLARFTIEDPTSVWSWTSNFQHGQEILPLPFIINVVMTPAGAEKTHTSSSRVVYSQVSKGADGSFQGQGSIEAQMFLTGVDTLTSTWVGPIWNTQPGGKGVFTYTNFQKVTGMNGTRNQVDSVDANHLVENSTMYGPNGAVWSRKVNGVVNLDNDAISSYFGSSADGASDDTAALLKNMFGIVMRARSKRSSSDDSSASSNGGKCGTRLDGQSPMLPNGQCRGVK
jgi:hypothetical protein